MDLSYGTEAEAFRKELRAFLKQIWVPSAELPRDQFKAFIKDFRLKATAKGYLYRAIPKAYGGSEQPVDVIKAQVIREEFSRFRAPMEIAGNGMNMTVPTLLEQGTEEQKELFIRHQGRAVSGREKMDHQRPENMDVARHAIDAYVHAGAHRARRAQA
jgi:alkylation response protein AidB-like acyl-CoA dehydrogenase